MPAHLGHEEFFTSLTNLLNTTSQKTRGSVYLTQKPLLNTNNTTTESASQPSILIRATDGNTNAPNLKTAEAKKKVSKTGSAASKVKISTVVSPDDLEAFYARLTTSLEYRGSNYGACPG
ncbi:signal recognition particle 14 kDa protein [Aspergillus neoniger CBS 115656]|uniref:Signal recognition particle, SRP9/SRP14 subunit n=1 Tax=Aspergillus neoniger (strain CBS 115656) TaxID=1448310 RepID=A0A318ZE93_ASPNB|nr:hypothetical protein BO87DRAFT_382652 [Aspergillus neoniger CBS 115656]PYH38658.1 hypothetical protein BO87DRAFT_382652 [Aspergillus neoniger CBS 115656]